MKKVITMVFAILLLSNLSVSAEKEISVFVDEKFVEFEVHPFVDNNRVLTPLRETFEALGVDVAWDDNTKTVICKKDDGIIKLTVDKNTAQINGANIPLDVPAQNINNRVFVPIRFISETLGADVNWDNSNRLIAISRGDNEINYIPNHSLDNLNPQSRKYVAHAGGIINNLVLTNSKEALDKSYKNDFNLIELDMQWSTDGNLVLLHDWGNFAKFIGSNVVKEYSTEEFTSLKMYGSLTPISIDDLALWLRQNHGAYIVTDIKVSNVQALRLIKDRYPDLIDRFIPQIYGFNEYQPVRDMGYENIIFTMYMSNYSDQEIISFAKTHKLFAVTMPIYNAKTSLPWFLKQEGIYTYTHTVNKSNLNLLKNSSIDGYYTDDLLP